MALTYTLVNVEPDTPAWLEERRHSIGASEAAAVMGLSPYQTPLQVYKSKLGVDADFDPILSYAGHASEPVVAGWLEKYSGLNLTIQPGFMARSVEHPYVHASFDRITSDGIPIQIKTAGQWTAHHWDEGIPVDYRVQVQVEMLVSGAPRALVAVWIGGREFRTYWETRDERFIREQLVPQLAEFWGGNVLPRIAPDAWTVPEIQERWPSEPEKTTEISDEAMETLERITVLNSDIKAQSEERDQLKVALARYVEDADTLTHEGVKVATWRSQKGRASFDQKAMRDAHPDIYQQYTRQGAPFRVLRRVKTKETNK